MKLELYYLAERDYVNGLTLFEEMLKAFMRESGRRPTYIKKFQVSRWVRTDALMEMHETASLRGNRRAREAAVRIDIHCDDDATTLLLFPLDDSPVSQRYEEYDRKAYVASRHETETGETRGRLAHIGDAFDWVRGVVEMNYQYVCDEAAKLGIEKGVSWAYLNEFPFPGDEQATQTLDAAFAPPKVFDAHGNRYYVRSITIPGLDDTGQADICYFFRLPEAAESSA